MLVTHNQQGVGLIEVMVAVLLLSVAVLGFSALQVRAVSATDESLMRTKSLTLVRNLAEVMRAYPEAYVTESSEGFASAASSTATATGAVSTVQAVVSSSAINTVTVDKKKIDITNPANGCLSTGTKQETVDDVTKTIPVQNCNMSQLAALDALMIKKIASDESIKVTVITCPGTQTIQTQMCVITAWNDTKALLDKEDDEACADENGVYKSGSHCLISEAY